MSDEKIDFDKYVRQIVVEVTDLTDAFVLLHSDKFYCLFKHMDLYETEALEVLSNPIFSNTEKHIVLFAIQGLDLENILLFSEKMLGLLEVEKIPYHIFRKTVFPPYEWNTKLPENFAKENVRKLLIKIKNSKYIESNLRRYINSILSGEALRGIKEMQADGMLSMRSVSESYFKPDSIGCNEKTKHINRN